MIQTSRIRLDLQLPKGVDRAFGQLRRWLQPRTAEQNRTVESESIVPIGFARSRTSEQNRARLAINEELTFEILEQLLITKGVKLAIALTSQISKCENLPNDRSTSFSD